ncbi:TetR/AcrR family transcriptional regulator [Nonomuraea endophytica]|uniref:AcrR family transcriptional regulator n=1 Tax=Nonomuraea endophytica TaxID=714136 RepID=A0A7W8EI75_9ACTN|nr:TetR/AcrR family transcriptional regulator [Nonomuraea endophytica]MBB5079362.1 AcrR family transcriptional regulator [Nonomuraea endophytica]
MREPTRKGGRPRVVDREAVARAVVEHGFVELSVSAIARRLGVNQATLYRHIGGQDDLVDTGVTLLIKQAAWPAGGAPWRELLEGAAWTVWGILRDNPGLMMAAGRRLLANDELIAAFNRLCLDLIGQGLPPDKATLAVDFVLDLACNTVLSRDLMLAGAMGGDREPPPAWTGNFDPRVLEVITRAAGPGHEEWFAGKLRIALDGIERMFVDMR